MKKSNPRMDLISRLRYPRNELFRLVACPSLTLEKDRPLLGRGVYLHKDKETLEKAKKRKALERAFHLSDCQAVYLEMEESL